MNRFKFCSTRAALRQITFIMPTDAKYLDIKINESIIICTVNALCRKHISLEQELLFVSVYYIYGDRLFL